MYNLYYVISYLGKQTIEDQERAIFNNNEAQTQNPEGKWVYK